MSDTWRSRMPSACNLLDLVYEGRKVAVWDCETSGLTNDDKIIQFSLKVFNVGNDFELSEQNSINWFINPEMPISQKITDITGIRNEDLVGKLPMADRIGTIKETLESVDVWVGHNLSFDVRMLKGECLRNAVSIKDKPVIDTLQLSRDWLRKGEDVENHKLGTVFEHLFPDVEITFHDSMEDVTATTMVFQHFCKKCEEYVNNPEDKSDKVPLSVNKAWVFINPRRKSQQRICLRLSDGDDGDIFYDIVDKQWGHKSSTAAKKLFQKVDMDDIEQQLLRKYRYPDIDTLAKSWLAYRRQKEKSQ